MGAARDMLEGTEEETALLLPSSANCNEIIKAKALVNGKKKSWLSWAMLVGPGMLVSLADTDAGCLIVAAASGAQWGYSLLLLQFILIPVLFLAQELTVRLGIHTQQGHTACIKKRFGNFWVAVTVFFLAISCTGATVSEMSGIAAVGELWGFSRVSSTLASAVLLVVVVVFCNYKQVELVGITMGIFEVTFLATMFMAKPDLQQVWEGLWTFHNDPAYMGLVAANIGAVIMPWMIYFQQSAIVAKKLSTPEDAAHERADTFIGTMLTQCIMIGALVTMAATREVTKIAKLDTVEDMATAMSLSFGPLMGKVLLSLGLVGGSLCAAFVVALAAAWGLCEAMGENGKAIDMKVSDAPSFYATYIAVVAFGVVILLAGVDVVKLNIYVEFMDALLMPLALFFLYVLATDPELPVGVRVQGWHAGIVAILFSVCSGFALYACVDSFMTGDGSA